jgi:hypothetical protein
VCATGELEPEGILEGAQAGHAPRFLQGMALNSSLALSLRPGKVRSRDFTDPLRPYEQQKRTVRGTIAWLKRSFNPIPPAGLRHTALPITGILVSLLADGRPLCPTPDAGMSLVPASPTFTITHKSDPRSLQARNRLVAVKAAKCQAALQQAAEAAASWTDEELASRASSLTQAGATALDILTRMQSLEELNFATVGAVLEEASVRCGSHGAGRKVLSAPTSPAKGRQTDTAIDL